MPDSCGPYNPEGCTKPCQQCYEGVIAGVKEYNCYGQCVVVDAYGRRHLGPGLSPPAGWTPSAGDSMAEMIADEIANINNSEPTPPTSAAKRNCSDRCGTICPEKEKCYRVLDRCKCFDKPPPNWWEEPLNILTQINAEEQKAALAIAKKFDPVYVKLCKGLCDDALSRVKAWLNDWYESCKSGPDKDRTITTSDGVVHPYCYYQYNSALKAAKDSNYNCKSDCTTTGGDFRNPYPTSTQDETSRAALTAARLNFNKRIGGGGTNVPVIPKQYTTVECDSKWCTCQGVSGCGDAAKCGGQCYWVNHSRVGGTSEPPGACTTCNFKCNPKGAPPESDEDDILVIRETEQVLKDALAKARKAANFDRNSTNPISSGPNCCQGSKCPDGYQCWRYGKNNNQCQCVLIINTPPLPKPWEMFNDQITPMY